MLASLDKASLYASYCSAIIPIVIFIARRGCLQQPLFKIFMSLLIVSAFAALADYLLLQNELSSTALNNIFYFVQFLLVSAIYLVMVNERRPAIYLICLSFCIYMLYVSFYLREINAAQYLTYLIGSAAIVIYVIIYIRYLFKTMPTVTILSYSPFWINTGIAFYFTFNVFVYMTSSYTAEHYPASENYAVWFFYNVNNVIKNGFFSLAMFFSTKVHLTPKQYVRNGIYRPVNFDQTL